MTNPRAKRLVPRIDALETRQMLSTAPAAHAAAKAPSLADLKSHYGLQDLTFPSPYGKIVADGSGQTVVIISGNRDPMATSSDAPGWANSPLARFSRKNHLPAGAKGSADGVDFEIVNADGEPGPLPVATTAKTAGEFDLDTQAIHAFAPAARIIDVQVPTTSSTNLNQAYATALRYTPAAISFSYSGPAQAHTKRDPLPDGNGTTYVQSAGDKGTADQYVSRGSSQISFHHLNGYDSLTVVLGGTILVKDANGKFTEVVWGKGKHSGDGTRYTVAGLKFFDGSGGGYGQYATRPSWQATSPAVLANATQYPAASAGMRLGPDLSLISQPGIKNIAWNPKLNGGQGGFQTVTGDGTSLSAPLFAGIIADVDQGRHAAGLAPLSSSDTLRAIYAAPDADFHDITEGSNGYKARKGFDLASGRGSVRKALILDLVGAPAITPG